MVASKNRMFRNASGKIVTVQDAVKAGLVNAEDIPKDKEAAIAFRDKLRDNLGQQDRDRLIDAASQRVGYRLTEKNMQVSGAAPKNEKESSKSNSVTEGLQSNIPQKWMSRKPAFDPSEVMSGRDSDRQRAVGNLLNRVVRSKGDTLQMDGKEYTITRVNKPSGSFQYGSLSVTDSQGKNTKIHIKDVVRGMGQMLTTGNNKNSSSSAVRIF